MMSPAIITTKVNIFRSKLKQSNGAAQNVVQIMTPLK